MMSLKPGSQVDEPSLEMGKGMGNSLDPCWSQSRPGMLHTSYIQDHQLGTKDSKEDSSHTADDKSRTPVSNGEDLSLCSPPRTENEVLKDSGLNRSVWWCGLRKCALQVDWTWKSISPNTLKWNLVVRIIELQYLVVCSINPFGLFHVSIW